MSARQEILISNNLPVRKNYFDSNIVQNENARLLRRFSMDYFEADVYRSTCLHTTSSRREVSALRSYRHDLSQIFTWSHFLDAQWGKC